MNFDFSETDKRFMRLALEQAKIAQNEGEVPIGCVIVKTNEVISLAHNRREMDKNSIYHAEILAIDKACNKLNGWRLIGCTLYVTLEPCPMCAGAIMNSRIQRVVYGAKDPKCGAMASVVDIPSITYYPKIEIKYGLYKDESQKLLKNFFKNLRKG